LHTCVGVPATGATACSLHRRHRCATATPRPHVGDTSCKAIKHRPANDIFDPLLLAIAHSALVAVRTGHTIRCQFGSQFNFCRQACLLPLLCVSKTLKHPNQKVERTSNKTHMKGKKEKLIAPSVFVYTYISISITH
jgi:hypothetical protein